MTRVSSSTSCAVVALATLCLGLMSGATGVEAASLQTDWVEGHNSRSRMSIANATTTTPSGVYAFIEIELGPGWKTYWRNPGDSGIPPRFEFKRSKNVEKVEVLYPAPMRIADPGGDILGYKNRVIFPVRLTMIDPAQPAEIGADVQFGICKDICVPSEAAFDLTMPFGETSPPHEDATTALDRVPRSGSDMRPGDPKPAKIVVDVKGPQPRIIVTATSPGGTSGTDVFVEAPDGLYFPSLVKTATSGDSVTFEADLSKDVDLAALTGKTLTITTVSESGATETTVTAE